MADREIYSHFLRLFEDNLNKEVGIFEEISEYEKVLHKVWSFCDKENKDRQLIIPPGNWSDGISILKSKCLWYSESEINFTKHLRQLVKIKVYSGNDGHTHLIYSLFAVLSFSLILLAFKKSKKSKRLIWCTLSSIVKTNISNV